MQDAHWRVWLADNVCGVFGAVVVIAHVGALNQAGITGTRYYRVRYTVQSGVLGGVERRRQVGVLLRQLLDAADCAFEHRFKSSLRLGLHQLGAMSGCRLHLRCPSTVKSADCCA